MSTEAVQILVVLIALVGGMFAGRILYNIIKHYREDWRSEDEWKLEREHAHPARVPMFCEDCGKTLVSYRSMDGYDVGTGAPRYSYQRACSDANRAGGPNTPGTWPYCGARAKQRDIMGGHNHQDPEATTPTCAACVDTMLKDGIIQPAQALGLYAKIEFTREDPLFPEGTDLWSQYMRQAQGLGLSPLPRGTRLSPLVHGSGGLPTSKP